MSHRRNFITMLLALFGLALASAPAAARPSASDRINVTVVGKGKDVVLIPGLGSSPKVWKEMIAAVPGYRYHLVHVRGFAGLDRGGNSSGDVAAPVAEAIASYIAAHKVGPVMVMGHSMGGSMAMMVAARHPKLVSKLIVVDMPPFMGAMFGGPTATPESVRPMAEMIMAQMKAMTPEENDKKTRGLITGMVANESIRPVAIADSKTSDMDVMARAYRELVTTDLRPELKNITAKTLVLFAAPGDAKMSKEQIDEYGAVLAPSGVPEVKQFEAYYAASYANLKGATLKRAPNSSHFIMWDNPAFFQREVEAFLKN